MRRSTLLGFAGLLMVSSAGCFEDEAVSPGEVEPGELDEVAKHLLRPFHVAVFDHAPTEAEIQGDLERHLISIHGRSGVSLVEEPSKSVRIEVFTSNKPNAGTEQADQVLFMGQWNTSSGSFIMAFVLDNPHLNDLNRNSFSVFHYSGVPANNSNQHRDQFVKGRVENDSTDGWHCDHLKLRETNQRGESRLQYLVFQEWVDRATNWFSDFKPASDPRWLDYD